ncbi:MAG: Glutathione S-transferase GstB [Alphaproteobacteria bacterium MarineAlpha2_Bin1]|nr:MAG: Glutathione S-transferase GstB [Alphaproteobacteria bacterium MarineAlpha2_Bin1]|tara:strand:- start:2144 stop:2764 length:621 start_codon:yes stop_codon:yes gene_type:complete
MLKIWGRDTSSNVQKVLWICHELNINFERVDVGGPFGGLDNIEFVKLNPHSKIPVINDNGYVLYESHAILRYLNSKYGKNRFSSDDVKEQSIIDKYMDWVHTELSAYMIPVLIGLIRTPEEKRNFEVINENNLKSENLWEILNFHLNDNKWISRNNFSLADICCGVWAWRRYNLDTRKKDLKNIDRWFKELKQRDSFIKIVMKPLS